MRSSIQPKQIRVHISFKQIKFFFLLLPFFELSFFARYSVLDNIYSATKLLVLAYMLLYLIKVKRKTRLSPFLVLIVIYEVYLIIDTVLHKGAVVSAITSAASVIGLLLLVQMLMEENSYHLICSMMFMFELMIYSNLLVMILYPNGLYGEANSTRHYWLFGHQNQTILYVIVAIMVAVIYMQMKKQIFHKKYSFRAFCLISCSAVSIFYIWSATSIVGLAIILAVVLLDKIHCRLTVWQGIIVSLILFGCIVLLQRQDLFRNIIQNILHRDITFTGRTRIWDRAIYCIKERPIFGYGVEFSANVNRRFGFNTTHCRYLYTLYQGGIVLFFIQIAIFACVAKEDREKRRKIPIILVACCWALFVQMSIETYANALFYLPFLFVMENDLLSLENNEP